jgi:hypothetical protein
MQSLVQVVRDAGFTNPLVVNKYSQPWKVVEDPMNMTFQSYHYYFNTWSLSGAISNVKTALSMGIKLINTEIGASYNEYDHFSSPTVTELNSFLAQCASLGVGNIVWMNYNGEYSNNYPRYQSLGLRFPTVSSPMILPIVDSISTNQSETETSAVDESSITPADSMTSPSSELALEDYFLSTQWSCLQVWNAFSNRHMRIK